MVKLNKYVCSIGVLGATLLAATGVQAKLADDIKNKGTENAIRIQMLLKRDLPASDVAVHVNKKIIQFAGFVDDTLQSRKLDTLVHKYDTQYKVINNVRILPNRDEPREEVAIRNEIQTRIDDYKYPVHNVDVHVRNGYVILSGFVDKYVPLDDIKAIALSVPGVEGVDNCLLHRLA